MTAYDDTPEDCITWETEYDEANYLEEEIVELIAEPSNMDKKAKRLALEALEDRKKKREDMDLHDYTFELTMMAEELFQRTDRYRSWND